MKKILIVFVLILLSIPYSFGQITIDGNFIESDYSLLYNRLNTNSGFAPGCEFTAIYFSRSDEDLYLGFECKIQNTPNQYNLKPDGLGIFLNFSRLQGKEAGQPLGINTTVDYHFLNGGVESYPEATLEFKADFEVDYLFAVYSNATSDTIILDAATYLENRLLNIQNLGTTDQSGTLKTGPETDGVFPADAIEYAFISSTGEGSKKGFEIKIPLSEINGAKNDWFQLFASMVSSTGYFSDQTIPGDVTSGNSGWAPDYLNNLTYISCNCPNPNALIGVGPFHTPQIGRLTLLTPNGGEILEVNTLKEIKWTSTESENIKIEYTADGDTTWNIIVASISASVGSYYWITPNIKSKFCRIRITDVNDPTLSDSSDEFFLIGKFSETEPNNTAAEANLLELNEFLNASLTSDSDVDYYKFSAGAGDTLEVSISRINNSFYYGITIIYDESGNALIYDYYSQEVKLPFIAPYTGNYFIRYATYWGEFPNKSFKDSVFIKSKVKNKQLLKTEILYPEEYRIGLKNFIPSAPKISFIFNYDVYFNSTRAGIEFFPNGLYTKIKFEYGKTPGFENSKTLPDSFNGLYFNRTLTKLNDLIPNSTYYLRAIAENDSGIFYSDSYNFYTPEEPDFWLVKSIDLDTNWYTLNDISFCDEKNGFAVGYDIIAKTTDGGDNWTIKNSGYYIHSVYCIDSLNAIAVGDYGTILRTTNGGLTWQTRPSGITDVLFDVFFADDKNGFAGTYGKILKTSNGGANWTSHNIGSTSYIYSIFFSDTSNGWAVGENGLIFKTTDGGKTWNSQNSGTYVTLFDVCFIDNNNGFINGLWDGSFLITTDGGNTWSNRNSGISDFRKISFIDRNTGIALASSSNIYLTTDGGNSWILQKAGTFNWLNGISRVKNNWFIAGDNLTILKSNYSLVSVDFEDEKPSTYQLSQNYPNPFNPVTNFKFSLPDYSFVTFKIYDILGKEVATIINEELQAGHYSYQWDATSFPSGVYFYSLATNNFKGTKKMILLK